MGGFLFDYEFDVYLQFDISFYLSNQRDACCQDFQLKDGICERK